jgi:hypothetical protein
MGANTGPDEKYCTSCGEPIKKQAEVCPECGVRQSGSGGGDAGASGGGLAAKIPGMKPGSTLRNVAVGAILAVVILGILGAAAGGDSVDTNDAGSGGDDNQQSGPDYAVKVQYSGDWSGAMSVTSGGDSTTESISGSGTETIPIDGEPTIVSANAQKQDATSETVVVQIIRNGEVVSEANSSSSYGVAQTSHTF